MNVLVIPTWYPSGEDKLMGNYHKEFTEALNQFGINANMLYIDRQRLTKPLTYLFMKKKEIESEKNYKVYKYKMLNVATISFKWQQKKYVKSLERAYKDYLKTNPKPDIIHAHVTLPAGYAACKLGKKYGIPCIVTEHCGNLGRFFKGELKEYGDYVLKNSTFSTVSKYMQKEVLKYKSECYVIPNLVDTKAYSNNIKHKIEDTFNLVSVCALREGKRIENLLEAIKRIIDDKKFKLHLDIIGDGFEEKRYKETCSKLKLDNYVTFLGRKNKKEISEILKKENALVISSELESFAIPGIEALASGIPIVSTKCLGPEEYMDEKCGVLCEVNNIESLKEGIVELYNKYNSYEENYLKMIANKYDKENIIENVKQIYGKITK